MFYLTLPSPVGDLLLTHNGEALTGLTMPHEQHGQHTAPQSDWQHDAAAQTPIFAAATKQLTAYFAGQLQHFDLPLAPQGTPFQQQVWRALCEIPYGHTRSYGWQAQAINNPKAVRAVGGANGRNPIGIVIPCHRVIGANGSLTGYGGGLPNKQWLLAHERHYA